MNRDGDGFGVPPAAILAALLVLAFLGLWRGLWTPDEPREAEISREMLLAPAVIPTLNGAPFVEKPPLYYWTAASAYALAGGPHPAAARAVSAIAGFLTLVATFLWGRRARSAAVGIIAAVMLATSMQFMLSTHWVLIDPLLMLFTTVAAWCAWELLQGAGGWRVAMAFYLALALALWTKGLIGPVLIGAGLAAWAAARRELPWRALRLGWGMAVMACAIGILLIAIYMAGGQAALHEFVWVNHVQRFLHPEGTGHDAPPLFYLWNVPFAVLPWLVPFLATLRRAHWRGPWPAKDFGGYCGVMSVAMIVVLSASATKRSIYLLPVLPLLFLGFAGNVERWRVAATRPDRWWLAQSVLFGVLAVGAPVAALVYVRRVDPVAMGFVALGLAACFLLVAAYRSRDVTRSLVAAGATALVATAAFLVLIPRVLDVEKDMAPFMAEVDRLLPAGAPVAALGADETLLAIVTFVTGRHVTAIDKGEIVSLRNGTGPRPDYLLVQTKVKKSEPPDLGGRYAPVIGRNFGPGRNIVLWRLEPE